MSAILTALLLLSASIVVCAAEYRISIRVPEQDNRAVEIEANRDDTINTVKLRIEELLGCPADQQILTWMGRETEDIRTLGDYNILANAELILIRKGSYHSDVSYSVTPSYTVTIPEKVRLGEDLTISAENVVLEKGKQLEVTLAGTGNEGNAFTLRTEEGAVIEYTVQDAEKQPISVGDRVLTVNPARESSSAEARLTFVPPVDSDIPHAGKYSETVTFSLKTEQLPRISFTVGDRAFTAEEGMTWREFIASDYGRTDSACSFEAEGDRILFAEGDRRGALGAVTEESGVWTAVRPDEILRAVSYSFPEG